MRQRGKPQGRKETGQRAATEFTGYSTASEPLVLRARNGSCRTVDVSKITIQFKDRLDLKMAFENAERSANASSWTARRAEFEGKSLLDAVKYWAGKDFEKRKIYLAVLFRYVHQTNDSRKYLELISELKKA